MNKIRSQGPRLLPALATLLLLLLAFSGAAAWSARAAEDPVQTPGLYFTDASSPHIYRANLDGSQVENVLTVSGDASAIIIDQAAGEMIFWAQDFQMDSVLWRAGLDGSDLRPAFLNLQDTIHVYWDRSVALGLDGKKRDLYWGSQQPYYYYEYGHPTSIVRGNLANGDIGVRFMPGPKDPFRYAEEQPDLEIDAAAGLFYWSDADGIRRATFDGVEAEAVVLDQYEPLYPLENTPFALDSEAGDIYFVSARWDDSSDIILVRADLDAPWNREELFAVAEYSKGQVMDVAVDPVHDKIYWSLRGRETAIKRANLDGTEMETIVGQVEGPQGLALDPAAGKIYWVDWLAQKVQRANLDGSALEDLVDTAPMRPRFLTLNKTAGMIYWTGRGNGRVWQAPMAGGEAGLLTPGESDKTGGIAYDPLTDMVFWTDTAGFLVTRARSDGTAVTDVLYPRVRDARGLFVEEEMGKLVWFDLGTQTIKRANLDGGAAETILAGDFGEATSIAWDPLRRSFCWADPIQRHIACAGWNGESRRTILSEADGLRRPNVLAIDARAGHVYWTDWGTAALHRANLDGSEMVDIIPGGLHEPSGLALNLEPLEVRRAFLPLVTVSGGQ